MKKVCMILCLLCLFGCASTSDLTKYEDNRKGVVYYLDEPQPKNNLRLYLSPDDNDTITSLRIATTYDESFIKQYENVTDISSYFTNKSDQQMKNNKADQKAIAGYGDFSQLSLDKKVLPFFSTVYEIANDELYNLEILNFNFCVESLDLSSKENKKLLKRYGLWGAYNKETGFLSYKKLKADKAFVYSFYFDKGVKEILE